MTAGELRAFIEGMSIEGAPTPEQWARISDKLALLEFAEWQGPMIAEPVTITFPSTFTTY